VIISDQDANWANIDLIGHGVPSGIVAQIAKIRPRMLQDWLPGCATIQFPMLYHGRPSQPAADPSTLSISQNQLLHNGQMDDLPIGPKANLRT
jgi:hypothetical protein